MSRVKVLVEGPALTRSGYGVHARLVLESLRAREHNLDIYVNPLNWGATGWLLDKEENIKWIHGLVTKFQNLEESQQNFDIHIHVGIPNEFSRKAPYAVCVTAGIEATKVSPSWIQKSYEMDKIIVPSNFSKWVFENTFYDGQNKETKEEIRIGCGAPVEVVSYPVREYGTSQIDLELEHDFNFLCVAQWGIRKNLEKTIKWFIEEFGDEEVGLVVKTNVAKNSTPDRVDCLEKFNHLLEGKDIKASIYLLHGEMTDEDIDALYRNPKIKSIISATHGEGFGLPLFEAAYNGLPVVAPGWSGHMDFLYAPVRDKKTKKIKNKPLFAKVDYSLKHIQKEAVWDDILVQDSMWCYPNKVDFKSKIRKVFTNYGMYKSWAEQLSSHLRLELSLPKILDKMLNTLVPERWLTKPEYIFVNDMFVEDYVGGAELSLETLIETCKSEKIVKIRTAEISEFLIENNKDAKWIFGNIANAADEMIETISSSSISYSFVEFDYKFCKHRNPALYEMVEGTSCDYKNTERGKVMTSFVNGASSVFFMSEQQMNIHTKNLPGIKNGNMFVLSSLFNEDFFKFIDHIRENSKTKSSKWVVLGSRSWVKGLNETESHCKESGYEYDVLWNLPYQQFLEKLAESKGLCFKPTGLDTCPRMVIEAKLLDCELDMNENVQHHQEEWFSKTYPEVVEYLKARPSFFWENSFV